MNVKYLGRVTKVDSIMFVIDLHCEIISASQIRFSFAIIMIDFVENK